MQATEEAIVNAMVAAHTVIGASGLRVEALPEDPVRALFAPKPGQQETLDFNAGCQLLRL